MVLDFTPSVLTESCYTGKIGNMKRTKHCKSAACDCRTTHIVTHEFEGSYWECQNCGELTVIKPRKPSAAAQAVQADLDRIFEALAAGTTVDAIATELEEGR